jgi:hypothetical protein
MGVKKKVLTLLLVLGALFAVAGVSACSKPADVVSQNISNDADSFKVNRRIVFYNGITNQYMLVIEGYCSLGNDDKAGTLSVTCMVGQDQYKKHFLGLSDNVTYFVEQITSVAESKYHYKVVFNPGVIVPDITVP